MRPFAFTSATVAFEPFTEMEPPDVTWQTRSRGELVGLGHPELHPPRDHVMPQVDAVGEELLDILHRGVHLAPVLLMTVVPLGLRLLLALLLIHRHFQLFCSKDTKNQPK